MSHRYPSINNLTAWIQPLDTGIICCVKAHYWQEQCCWALDQDAGEEDIWVMDQLEAMCLMDCAWDNITVDTIVNCWGHTKILPSPKEQAQQGMGEVSQAWLLMQEFATSDMQLLQAKEHLEKIFGGQYKAKNWKPALKAVMDAENNVPNALASLNVLKLSWVLSRLPYRAPGIGALPRPQGTAAYGCQVG
jgi:hypothetical protein